MPVIYEYLGIKILFYSGEHKPIHVHAVKNGNVVKVSFYVKNGKITRVIYKAEVGKFSPSDLKHLKSLIDDQQYNILKTWSQYFVYNIKPRKQVYKK